MHTIRIRRSLFRFQLLPVTNSNCGAQMAWSEVASGSPWSSIEIEAQNCLFGCANRVTDVIYIMHVFVGSTARHPRFIWGLEARSSDFLNSAPDAALKKFYVTQTQRSKQCGLTARDFRARGPKYVSHCCQVASCQANSRIAASKGA